MSRVGLRLSLVLLLVFPLSGQTGEWKQYKNADGNFAALFPAPPEDSVNQADAGISSHTLLARESSAIYTVIYTTMAAPQTVDEPTYQVFKAAVMKQLPNCSAADENSASPVIENYIGHSYRMSCAMSQQVSILGNLYWGKHYAYAVMVMFRTTTGEPANVRKFVDSFAVIDPAK